MFRDTSKSKLDPLHFGAGSTIQGGPNEEYMIISAADGKCVQLIDMQSFTVVGVCQVQDANHLSEDEARKLVSSSLDGTFSDFSMQTRGYKK